MSERLDADSPLLEEMIGAALEAGRAIHAIYAAGFEVSHKADRSPVTNADHAAEAIILQRLAAVAPRIAVVAEEQAAAGRIPVTGREFFLVDPLDGTKEFIQRRGDFTVNIALIRDAAPVLGVVYAPARSELFGGDVAAGQAFRSEQSPTALQGAPRRSIRVRRAPAAGLIAVVSRSHSTPQTDVYLAQYAIGERVAIGSSLKFCLLAAGEADLYPRLGPTMEWDTAAGHAVLLAAGGTVLAAGGTALTYGKPGWRNASFVASGSLAPVPLDG